MKNLTKNRVRVVKKSEPQQPIVIRCGARVSHKTKDKVKGKWKSETRYSSDYSTPTIRETNTVMQEETI